MNPRSFRIKRSVQAVALALAFGASVQVTYAANQTYCWMGLPGMGCNLPQAPNAADSTMVGSLPTPPYQAVPPSWNTGSANNTPWLEAFAGKTFGKPVNGCGYGQVSVDPTGQYVTVYTTGAGGGTWTYPMNQMPTGNNPYYLRVGNCGSFEFSPAYGSTNDAFNNNNPTGVYYSRPGVEHGPAVIAKANPVVYASPIFLTDICGSGVQSFSDSPQGGYVPWGGMIYGYGSYVSIGPSQYTTTLGCR